MEQQSSNFVCIFNWKKDKILLSYHDKFESWEVCHIGDDEVTNSLMINAYAYIKYLIDTKLCSL